MPANRFNGFTEYGIGIGLRAPHYDHILSRKPVVDWFEIISENFMIDGGRPLQILDQILEQYKVVQHGVSMYFGSAEKPNREHLRRLKELLTDGRRDRPRPELLGLNEATRQVDRFGDARELDRLADRNIEQKIHRGPLHAHSEVTEDPQDGAAGAQNAKLGFTLK